MVLGRFGSGLVLLKPAPEGTGVIAGGPVRAVIQAVGHSERADEIHRLQNPHNVVKATINALEQLRDKAQSPRCVVWRKRRWVKTWPTAPSRLS